MRLNTYTCVLLCPVVLQILDETSAAVAALEAQQWRASTERSLEYARSLGAKAAVTLQVGTRAMQSCSSFAMALRVLAGWVGAYVWSAVATRPKHL
jgi:hypothetical protein